MVLWQLKYDNVQYITKKKKCDNKTNTVPKNVNIQNGQKILWLIFGWVYYVWISICEMFFFCMKYETECVDWYITRVMSVEPPMWYSFV